MKYKTILILLIFIIAITISGCSSQEKSGIDQTIEKHNQQIENSVFQIIENTYNWTIMYHKDTKVMYAKPSYTPNLPYTDSFTGTLSVLVDSDGMPMLYDESYDPSASMFVVIEDNQETLHKVVYHIKSKVIYYVYYGNFTTLLNPDGSPMVWSETD